MQNLNNLRKKLNSSLIKDKFEISYNQVSLLKNELCEVFKKYTKSEDFSINLSIRILKSNKYEIEICVTADDLIF